MTNPNDAVGTNAAYGSRTSVNAFNDFAQLVNGRGILSGWAVQPKAGMVVEVGGIAGTRDVAIAEDNLGNRTTVNNRSNSPIEVEIEAASASSNRYDAIVVYVNNPAQASDTTPDAPSVCGIIDVRGGTTGVSEQQIRSAITSDGGTGSVAYYAVLATVLVSAGTTTITSANISQSHIAISADDIGDGEITQRMLGDTGWIDLSSYIQSPTVYAARPDNPPRARVIGGTVYLAGEIYCKVSVGVNTSTILKLPAAYAPKYQITGAANQFDKANSQYNIWVSGTSGQQAEIGNIVINQPGSKIPSTQNYQGYTLSAIPPFPLGD